jgi:signal transduction histidine kinase
MLVTLGEVFTEAESAALSGAVGTRDAPNAAVPAPPRPPAEQAPTDVRPSDQTVLLGLTRAIHEHVVQRLFSVSLVLGIDGSCDQQLKAICAAEVNAALKDLRGILRDGLECMPSPVEVVPLADALAALANADDVRVTRTDSRLGLIAPGQAAVAQSVLVEAVRNARKHAPDGHSDIEACIDGGLLRLSVTNDGVHPTRVGQHGQGVGLTLACEEAHLHGGLIEHGLSGPGRWRVLLTLPVEASTDAAAAPEDAWPGTSSQPENQATREERAA